VRSFPSAARRRIRDAVYADESLWRSYVTLRAGANVVDRLLTRSWRFEQFGDRSVIRAPLSVAAPDLVSIGADVSIGRGSWLSLSRPSEQPSRPTLRIGDGANFGRRLCIVCAADVEIGPAVLAADNVFIADTYHEYIDASRPVLGQGMATPRPVRIGAGAFLGVNSVILPGVTVGDRAYVGAGAVVTKSVPPFAVVVGNPARIIRTYDEAGGWQSVEPPAVAT